ncbi:F-box/kelch-repeat protein At3g23880-like [Malania oleifera]|uniref:F-box/kelch-repeat protein At3g23880-like n=1 Tax=Malania oleifera TaxID=397392 RepID=UPI0025ADB41C|nr:F-box/kelch-repeat protein At3g23880-like [Malania oleifera]
MKRSRESASGLPYLPTEIVEEILVRLPPRSVGRLRCVCKSWAALTSSPFFINTHASLCSSNNNNHQILCTLPFWNPNHRHSIYLLRRGGAAPLLLNFPPSIRFENSPESQLQISSHHGLVCLWTHSSTSPIYLWNPLTGETRTLPPSRLRSSQRVRYVWAALGSLRLSDGTEDYKVVRVVRFKNKVREQMEMKAEVYSLRRGCWKDVAINSNTPLMGLCTSDVAVANQSVNWVGMQYPFGFAVVSFDVAAETFRCIYFSQTGRPFVPRLGVWKGSVVVLVKTETGEWEVWAMGKMPWEKLFVFRPEDHMGGSVMPLGLTKGGEVLLLQKGYRSIVMIAKEWGKTGVIKVVDEEFVLPVDADDVNMFMCALCAHTESLVPVT